MEMRAAREARSVIHGAIAEVLCPAAAAQCWGGVLRDHWGTCKREFVICFKAKSRGIRVLISGGWKLE